MIYTHAAAALMAAALAFGAAWKVQDWRHDAAEKDRIEQEAKERGIRSQRIDTAATRHERDKGEIRTEFITIEKEVRHVVEKPVYRDGMCLDDDGLRVLRAAINPRAAASEPSRAMP